MKKRRNPSAVLEKAKAAGHAVASGYRGVKRGIRKVDRAIDTVTTAGAVVTRTAMDVGARAQRVGKAAGTTLNMLSLLGYSISTFLVYTVGKGFYTAYKLKMATQEMKDSVAVIKTGSATDIMTSLLVATGLKPTITREDQNKAVAAMKAKLGKPATGMTPESIATFDKTNPVQVAAMKVKLGYTASPKTMAEFKKNTAILDQIRKM